MSRRVAEEDRLVRLTVTLKPSHRDLLRALSYASEQSVSDVLRRVLNRAEPDMCRDLDLAEAEQGWHGLTVLDLLELQDREHAGFLDDLKMRWLDHPHHSPHL
jgi:hypothetical protein